MIVYTRLVQSYLFYSSIEETDWYYNHNNNIAYELSKLQQVLLPVISHCAIRFTYLYLTCEEITVLLYLKHSITVPSTIPLGKCSIYIMHTQ